MKVFLLKNKNVYVYTHTHTDIYIYIWLLVNFQKCIQLDDDTADADDANSSNKNIQILWSILRRGGKNTQKNYTKKIFMTEIITMVWSPCN